MKQDYLIDRDLIKKTLAGDTNAFRIIISNTQGLVLQIIYRLITNQEDREDLAQEVYLKVYSKLSSFKFNAKLSTWIGTITYNTCINYLEKKKIAILDIDTQDDIDMWDTITNNSIHTSQNITENLVLKNERARILEIEIEKLPPIYKTIITLFHSEELSYKEISKITNLPEGTLKNYLFRARKKIRENISFNYKKEDL